MREKGWNDGGSKRGSDYLKWMLFLSFFPRQLNTHAPEGVVIHVAEVLNTFFSTPDGFAKL